MTRHSSSLLWWIVAVLTVMTIAVSLYLFGSEQSQTTEPINMQDQSVQPSIQPKPETVVAPPEFKPKPNKILVEEKLLTEPIPEHTSLAKEEVDKQTDIQQQLLEQEKLLQQQNLTADELIRLKEQQIKLLEQQLAEATSSP
jgi:hypothetical protein